MVAEHLTLEVKNELTVLVAIDYPKGFLSPPRESKVRTQVVALCHEFLQNMLRYCGTRDLAPSYLAVKLLEGLSSFLGSSHCSDPLLKHVQIQ